MRALILAAGRGERMRPLTLARPKPLLEVGGRALIEHHLLNLAAAGFRRVAVNLSWLGEQIEATIGDGSRCGVQVTYSHEGPEPLETGGGIFRAMPQLQERADEPFLVLNGDVWMDYPYARLRDRFEKGMPGDDVAHVVLVPNPAHNPNGDFLLDDGRMLEPAPASASGAVPRYTFSGLGVYRAGLFAGCTDGIFKLAPLLRAAARAGRVSAELYPGDWLDIGTPERLAALDARLRAASSA
jgi:MurNAc alpha-1-phosphate uridylyltransferase